MEEEEGGVEEEEGGVEEEEGGVVEEEGCKLHAMPHGINILYC